MTPEPPVEGRPYNVAEFDLTDEFLDRMLRGEPAFEWLAAQIAEDGRRFMRGPSLVIALAVWERVLVRMTSTVAGLEYKELIRAMSEDLTFGGDDSPEDIHEAAGLAGADVDVPEEIEERLKTDDEDDEEEKGLQESLRERDLE